MYRVALDVKLATALVMVTTIDFVLDAGVLSIVPSTENDDEDKDVEKTLGLVVTYQM